VEGTFDPASVMLLPPGFKPKMDASGSEVSVDSFSDNISESEFDDDEQGNGRRPGEFTEAEVVEWLYSAGFPQYVDMFQSKSTLCAFFFFFFLFLSLLFSCEKLERTVINEGEVVHDHSFLSPPQIQV